MNTKKKWLRTSLCALALIAWLAAPGLAQAQEEHGEEHQEGGHDSDAAIPESAHKIVVEIFTRDLMIQDFIETGQLTKIHKPAFEAKDLVESLVEMNRSDHESSLGTKLSAASKRIGLSAKLLDKYGDAEDAAKTSSAYKTFGAAIQNMRALYPDVTPEHYWTCSMHPDVWKAAAGQCTKCTMKLVEKHLSPHEELHEAEEHHDENEDEH